MRNDGTLAGLADDDVVEVPARVTQRGRRAAGHSRRSRPSCSGSCSTSPPTSGSRCTQRSAATRSTCKKALLAHPLIGQYADRRAAARADAASAEVLAMSVLLAVDGGNSKTDLALVARRRRAARARARPAQLAAPPRPRRLRSTCSQRLVDEAGLDGRRADVAQVLLAGVDFPEEEAALRDALGDARLGGDDARRQRHVRRAPRRHRARLGRRRHLRRGHQLRRRRAGRPARALPRAR